MSSFDRLYRALVWGGASVSGGFSCRHLCCAVAGMRRCPVIWQGDPLELSYRFCGDHALLESFLFHRLFLSTVCTISIIAWLLSPLHVYWINLPILVNRVDLCDLLLAGRWFRGSGWFRGVHAISASTICRYLGFDSSRPVESHGDVVRLHGCWLHLSSGSTFLFFLYRLFRWSRCMLLRSTGSLWWTVLASDSVLCDAHRFSVTLCGTSLHVTRIWFVFQCWESAHPYAIYVVTMQFWW